MSDVGKINVLGLGSGLDLQGILDKFREIERQPIERMEAEKDYYENRLNEYDWLNTQVLDLKSDILDLSLESTYLTREASVTGSAVEASADLGALTGSYTVEVSQLARRSLWQSSSGFANSSDVVTTSDDVLQIAVGDENFSILVPANTTLQGLADLINNDENNPGVKASVVNTGSPSNPYHLVLQAQNPGEENRIVVTQELSDLAFEEVTGKPNITRSNNYANPTDVVTTADTTLTIQVDSLSAKTINIPANTTLEDLVDLINEEMSDTSLKAYLMRDASNNYFIDLRSPETINITDDPSNLFPNQIETNGESLNAFLTVDGISYQRGSNSINDIIPGVTLTLKQTGSSTVFVSSDYENIQNLFSSFIEKVNNLIQDLREKMSVDQETGENGPLYRSSVAEDLIRDLQDGLLTTIDNPNGPKSLFDLGVNFNRDGTITLDEETLSQAIANNPEGVKTLLVGDEDTGLEGIAQKINDALQRYIGANGLIAIEQKGVQGRIDRLETDIERAEERVDAYIDTLQKQFRALDEYLNSLNELSSYLDLQFKSIMGLTEKR